MAKQVEAPSTAELFQDEILAGQAAEIEAVIAQAHGDPRAAVGALLVQLAEVERARREAETSGSLGYRRGNQPPRPVRRD